MRSRKAAERRRVFFNIAIKIQITMKKLKINNAVFTLSIIN